MKLFEFETENGRDYVEVVGGGVFYGKYMWGYSRTTELCFFEKESCWVKILSFLHSIEDMHQLSDQGF